MVHPIYVFGSPVLRIKTELIIKGEEGFEQLVEDLFETMYSADGVGLAAPQIGFSKRIFIIDGEPLKEDDPQLADFKKIFVNPKITRRTGELVMYNEGCLSVPNLREDIYREPEIIIEYYDENFNFFKENYKGLIARIIQHEYDHLDGILFTDKVSQLKKKLLKTKLIAISKGKVDAKYKINFPKK